ncbi:hypothetical protein D3C71_2013410 [compost metagenome]
MHVGAYDQWMEGLLSAEPKKFLQLREGSGLAVKLHERHRIAQYAAGDITVSDSGPRVRVHYGRLSHIGSLDDEFVIRNDAEQINIQHL